MTTPTHPFQFANPDYQHLFDLFAIYCALVEDWNQAGTDEQKSEIKTKSLAAQGEYADFRERLEALCPVLPIPQVMDSQRFGNCLASIQIAGHGECITVAKRRSFRKNEEWDDAEINWSALGAQKPLVARRMRYALDLALEIAATLDAKLL